MNKETPVIEGEVVEEIEEIQEYKRSDGPKLMEKSHWFTHYSAKAFKAMQHDFEVISKKFAMSPPQQVEFKKASFKRYCIKFGLTNKYLPH